MSTWNDSAPTLVSVTLAALAHCGTVVLSPGNGSSFTARHSNPPALPVSYSSDGQPVPTAMALSKSTGTLPHVVITSVPPSAVPGPRSIDTRSAR
jgi:hypothetical protein